MEKDYSSWIKVYIIDVLPILAVALYILGFFYTGCYYSAFGVSIEKYISWSEMLLDIIFPLISITVFYLLMLVGYYFLTSDVLLPHLRKKLDRNIKKYKELEGNQQEIYKLFIKKNNKLLKVLLISSIISLVLYIGANELKGDIYIGPTMISPFILCFLILLLFTPLFFVPTPNPQRSVMILETVVVFYIYAAIVFGYSGYKDGLYIKNHDTTQFEIKTNDGEIFNNRLYRYFDQVNDRVFLLEKKTQNKIIIGKENIIYMKMKYITPPKNKRD